MRSLAPSQTNRALAAARISARYSRLDRNHNAKSRHLRQSLISESLYDYRMNGDCRLLLTSWPQLQLLHFVIDDQRIQRTDHIHADNQSGFTRQLPLIENCGIGEGDV